ncbi:MAG: 2OG-Fe(II) oxygenase [Gammaproteobacteria bacterium]|nr:2OG-Fe(II) oxygenase [Gammaproteobacteria bacterium]
MRQTLSLPQLIARAEAGDAEAQYCLASALHGQGRAAEAASWLERAAAAGHGHALCSLGLMTLDGRGLSPDLERARALLRTGARAGSAQAAYHLAELHGFSDYPGADNALSLAWLQQAARQGFGPALRCLGFAWAAGGAWEPARALFAAAGDDGPGLHALGLCWLRGLGGAAEPGPARAAFEAALGLGETRAAHHLDGELAGIAPAPHPLPPPSAELLSATPPAAPLPEARDLLAAPRVYTRVGLYSELECDYLINLAATRVSRSLVGDPLTGGQMQDPVRTSRHFTVGPALRDLVQEALDRRIARCAGLPLANGEFLCLLNYRPGQEYKPHHDYFRREQPGSAQRLRLGGQRVQTLLVYLNEDYAGGETVFPRVDFRFRPRRGDLLHFHNVDAQGVEDELSLHAGEPVLSGEKWLASKWLRANPYPPRRFGAQGLESQAGH